MKKNKHEIKKGERLVSAPHIGIYNHLMVLLKDLETVRSVQRAKNRKIQKPEPEARADFIISAGKIYPALYIEALLNFIAVRNDIQFRSDFERFSAKKKFQLYMYFLTNQTVEKKYIDFIQNVASLRDSEVHPKPEINVVGRSDPSPQYEAYRQCTFQTILFSIDKLYCYIDQLLKENGHAPLGEKLYRGTYPKCHQEINSKYQL